MKVSFFLFLFACACSTNYLGKDVYGADEFVIDSYKIQEGKFSILEMQGKIYEQLPSDYLEEYPDAIHEDDVLKIFFYHPLRNDLVAALEKISQAIGFRVVNGQICLPEIEPLVVEGITLGEAAERIKKRYSYEIEDLQVFVAYKERIVRKVELAGLVQVPHIPVDGKLRLFDALSIAKIPPDANLFRSYIARKGKILPIDFYKLLKEGDMSQNIVLRGGDKIYIAEPSASSLMVMGEVGVERAIFLPNGKMSLREAIAEARGIPYTGDKNYIQVIRGSIQKPKIYLLNWQHVVHLPNDSLLLMPGDVVYVASKPITEWNRFITQLLPSVAGLETAGKGVANVGVIVP